ncbi:hypothetical protein BS47DRAFT_524477 [Hydnum rufescens UP504]|uniref:Uncharacterized protein n=1 Tax=Hydnum rufescens UP504 TaxID=1448309 RepID=A0A9P6E0Q1_9AGAM|nr:hypothetical protein BS47DRAFT_524477 [Hydnum rufescens UP504]
MNCLSSPSDWFAACHLGIASAFFARYLLFVGGGEFHVLFYVPLDSCGCQTPDRHERLRNNIRGHAIPAGFGPRALVPQNSPSIPQDLNNARSRLAHC